MAVYKVIFRQQLVTDYSFVISSMIYNPKPKIHLLLVGYCASWA